MTNIQIKKFIVGVMGNNAYLVTKADSKNAVLIDPSTGYKKISAYCKDNDIIIKDIILTHGHFDHINDVAKFQRDGAKVYIHEVEADKLYTDGNLAYMLGQTVEPSKADVTFKDNDTLSLCGIDFSIIHTPGHSSGSVCIIAEQYMFSGDTIFLYDRGRVDFPDSSPRDMQLSLKRLFGLPNDYIVLPGHGDNTTLDNERVR
ncbi:MAG: MBL fold metallo-hydrolase [Bacillota bacterium]